MNGTRERPALEARLNGAMAPPFSDAVFTEGALQRSCGSVYNRVVKRGIDFLLALCGLAVLWPVLLAIAAAVAIDTGFPVLYRAERGGYHGKPFRICKFRTMVRNADQIGGGTTALHDARITRVGGFLRKTKLDETVQLLDVLLGRMSFVGPRPELLRYTNAYEGLEPYILEVRPGITDFSSLAFISLDEMVGAENADEVYETEILKKKNLLRLQYVSEVSFLTDLKIFCKTVLAVLKKAVRVIAGGGGKAGGL